MQRLFVARVEEQEQNAFRALSRNALSLSAFPVLPGNTNIRQRRYCGLGFDGNFYWLFKKAAF